MQQRAARASPTAQVAAAVIGNALEWYDFIVYGFLTLVIARLFFPTDSQYGSLLLTAATFGVGFFMRPVGGILLGLYADRKGRKPALQLILGLMTVAIALIAFSPTYASIGMAAPLLIVLARLLQGLATGGEFASATSFLVEAAPANRRGFYGSWQMFGQGLAVLAGAGMGALVTKGLSPEAFESWGWRVPFMVGLLIGPVGLWIRRHLDETDAFLEAQKQPAERRSIGAMLRNHLREVLVTMGLIAGGTASFYVVLVYMPTFVNTTLGMPLGDAFLAQAIGVAWMVLLIPLSGALSDRIGRRPIILTSMVIYLLMLYPLFIWISARPSFGHLVIMQLLLCSAMGGHYGPVSTAIAEQFRSVCAPLVSRSPTTSRSWSSAVSRS